MARIFLIFFFFGSAASLFSQQRPSVMPVQILANASGHARADTVGSGLCGRGLWSVLTNLGYAKGIESANGQDWEERLSAAGWVPWSCPSPELAPYGAVLVYLSDVRLYNKNLVGTAGGRFGHAELVAFDNGSRVYVSDAPRNNAGGTVPHNFTRRAWVPPGMASLGPIIVSPTGTLVSLESIPDGARAAVYTPTLQRSQFDPVALQRHSAQLVEERRQLARAFFAR